MFGRKWSMYACGVVLALVSTSLASCGHSEEEWQAELAKEKKLRAELDAEHQAHKNTQSELDRAKADIEQLKKDLESSESMKAKLGGEKGKLEKALMEAEARRRVLEEAKRRLEALKRKLDELKRFNLNVAVRHNQIVIEMPGDVLFDSGSEVLKKEGKAVLTKVADIIKGDPDLFKRAYQVVGHTDNQPYPATGKFKDNVGLSVMRAREVYQFLTTTTDPKAHPPREGAGLPPERWSAAGYGELDPIAGTRDAQDDAQRKRNRRVEIAIVPDASELMKLDVE